jgi:hypothetical protein
VHLLTSALADLDAISIDRAKPKYMALPVTWRAKVYHLTLSVLLSTCAAFLCSLYGHEIKSVFGPLLSLADCFE